MKKSTKKWLIAALILVLVGGAIVAAVTVYVDMDYSRLNTEKYVTNTTEITEDFDNIQIKTYSADITFIPTKSDKCKVVCNKCEDLTHTITSENGTLSVDEKDNREFIDKIAFTVSSPTTEITVYLPVKEYGKLQINDDNGDVIIPEDFTFTDITVFGQNGEIECNANADNNIEIETYSGDINLSGVTAKGINLNSKSGEIELKDIACSEDCIAHNDMGDVNAENVSCGNFLSDALSGEIRLKNVVANKKMDIQRNTGDIRLHASDADEIYLKTESGSITGTILTEKIFLTETQSGNVSVPKTVKGGKCEIITEWGDIDISLD